MEHLHEYVRLLYEACHTSESVDYFDLHSDNAASMTAWQWLLHEQYTSNMALLCHVRDHAEDIIAALGPAPADVPLEPPAALLRAADLPQMRHAFLSRTAIAAEKAVRDAS